MLQVNIDGKALTVPKGTFIIEAAMDSGTYIPHFCYHKKLSIAANCRMCLVEVEKAPKPLPACATPITDGMVVKTRSDLAKKAQQGVMEFLLINHPLDCPICDQGGECQLQDLAVGYGKTTSRYEEEKRSVVGKDMGVLVSAEEMSRCIHCTRCVRFSEEVGGFQEIGMANRSEFAEILPFLNKTIDSEISGNMIDLCPVGALTSKPFRYDARSWELSRRKSISAHDGLGSNLIVQVKDHLVRRVLPLSNEAINECWLSDRDRFAYEGLNHAERLTAPMIKQDGQWLTVDWDVALNYVVSSLNGVAADYGKESIGFLLSSQSTNEELFLAANLARAFGVNNIDSRLRQSDFSADALRTGATWLGGDITDLAEAQSIFVIGSSLRAEHPLLAARVRAAVKKGSALNILHAADDALLCEVHAKLIHQPSAWVSALNGVLQTVLASVEGSSSSLKLDGVSIALCEQTKAIAANLLAVQTAEKSAFIVMGELAQHHPDYAKLHALCQELARLTGAKFGVLAVAANSVGAQVVGALPLNGGLNAREMLTQPRKSYFLLNTEIEYDAYAPTEAMTAMKSAQSVIALTAYASENLLDYADVLLPITPFTETAGSFINMAGTLQSFNGVVRPLGQSRPAWKVLRVLANLLNLPNFDYDNVEAIRSVFVPCDIKSTLNNQYNDLKTLVFNAAVIPGGLQRLGEVPMFSKDSITRRATALQKTVHAAIPKVYLHTETLIAQGLQNGDFVLVINGNDHVKLQVKADDVLAKNTIRLAAAKEETLVLGGLFDPLVLEKGA